MAAPTAETLIERVTSGRRARRMVQILELVSERGTVGLAELSDGLSVSAATVRRDLSDLADQNLLLRTHGGAAAVDRGREIPVALRNTRFQEAKRAIAKTLVSRLPSERYVIALCGGTTTASVARELAHHHNITVVTNSLTIAGLLSEFAGVRVVMTGGFLRPQSLELVGALAENTFTAVNVGTAILGADGISASAGVTTHDETEARTNLAMVTKAQRTVVVADGSKVGRAALAQVCGIEQVRMLITDSTADPAELERLRAAGVEVVVADAPERS
ncbi:MULTISPECIES: DeoR/GlpR family DNA-binding transcription regulator [unclassified Plantibacter]|uniref:DeoR/GlpR family DNA-binding transcription regulator n=1 Tax=unclassified Plantibacter TaxID=2624265 RepID=UPI003D34170F